MNPSSRQWESIREAFQECYWNNNMSLPDIIEYFAKEHNFHASERMFKTRIQKWGCDEKKIRYPVYRAMYQLLEDRTKAGKYTYFTVSLRGARQEVHPEKIRKEIRRHKAKGNAYVEDEKARAIIAKADIRCHTPAPELPESSSHVGAESSGQRVLRANSISSTFSSQSSGVLSPVSEADLGEDSFPQSSPGSAYDINYGPGLPSTDKSLHPTANSVRVGAPNSSQKLGIAESKKPELVPLHFTEVSISEYPIPSGASSPKDFDFSSAFAHLSLDPCYNRSLKDQVSSFVGAGNLLGPADLSDHEKILASRWAAPYISRSLSNGSPQNTSQSQDDHTATATFRKMLLTHNRYVFPGLNWMVTVLSSIGNIPQLVHFLEQSCHVIDHEMGENLPFGTPFHYALATYTDNAADIARYSGAFKRTHEQIRLIWGDESPNLLVNRYYWAWHLLTEKKYSEVIQMLQICLEISQNTMGSRDTLTINCLAMLSRTYAETMNNDLAIKYLTDATERLNDSPPAFRQYQLVLLRRLAMLQISIQDYQRAENTLRELVAGRRSCLGLQHPYTWGAVRDLCDFIAERGRTEESQRLWHEMHVECDREQLRPIYEERQQRPPWEASQ